VFFPTRPADVPDQPSLMLVVLPPDQMLNEAGTQVFIEKVLRESGNSSRQFKSALIFVARKIRPSFKGTSAICSRMSPSTCTKGIRLDEKQTAQLNEGIARTKRDVREGVAPLSLCVLPRQRQHFEERQHGVTHPSMGGAISARSS
jgi:hypothetical protein